MKTAAIIGANGSGKSTLLQTIAGAIMQSEGSITYTNISNSIEISSENAFKYLSIVAPYLDLIEEMTAAEFLSFHNTFKELTKSINDILMEVGLSKDANKQIRYFSSGMKQRLKLAQAFFSNTSLLLLDEPTTNLDVKGIQLYQNLISNYTKDRLVIVSSNDINEYQHCSEIIEIENYK
jgi:ABC-type multidrug transport system ATPase subunit